MTTTKPAAWRQSEAIAYCIEFEAIARSLGMHIALTGSVLYGGGTGKDLDIIVWGHGDKVPTGEDMERLLVELHQHFGLVKRVQDANDPSGGPKLIEVTEMPDGRRIDWIMPIQGLREDLTAHHVWSAFRQECSVCGRNPCPVHEPHAFARTHTIEEDHTA